MKWVNIGKCIQNNAQDMVPPKKDRRRAGRGDRREGAKENSYLCKINYPKVSSLKQPVLPLLLSCFSHVQLCATPQMAAHQAPLSVGFSSTKSLQSCLTLFDPMNCSSPSSSAMGFSRQEYWSGHALCQGMFSTQGLNLHLSPASAGRFFTLVLPGKPQTTNIYYLILFQWVRIWQQLRRVVKTQASS